MQVVGSGGQHHPGRWVGPWSKVVVRGGGGGQDGGQDGGGQDGDPNLGSTVLGGDGRPQPHRAGGQDLSECSDYNALLLLLPEHYDQRF